MPKIQILSDKVANQIAAGEVVERPMSVLKELLENAIDAKATRINIEFRNGGRNFMSIEDNGIGMSRDEALLALERHATSKIREAADLDTIQTFGFRGEALPSIASVSHFVLRTKPEAASTGTEIFILGGKYIHCRDFGMSTGTKIQVSNLFQSVPARLKFLKSENTEAAHITRAIRLYAVAHPNVSFTLWENGKEIFRSPANLSPLDRVAAIWGKSLADDLIPLVPAEEFGMKISGLIGKPGVSRASRQEMVTIVNGRPVDNRTMAYSLVESYHTLIPRGRFPLAFIFFEIDPHFVDVNVHPAKREIRFRDESKVRNFLIKAVLKTLNPSEIAPENSRPIPRISSFPSTRAHEISSKDFAVPEEKIGVHAKNKFPKKSKFSEKHSGVPAGENFEKSAVPEVKIRAAESENSANRANENFATRSEESRSGTTFPPKNNFGKWNFLTKIPGENIAILQSEHGLILFNWRFARERIFYEQVLTRFENSKQISQQLLFAEPLELDPILGDALLRNSKKLSDAGFDFQEFGRNFFRNRAVPDWLPQNSNVRDFVRDLLSRISRYPAEFSRSKIAYLTLAKIAGTQAASREESYDEAKIREIFDELFRCEQPNVSPNGQKIFVEISKAEISKKFGIC